MKNINNINFDKYKHTSIKVEKVEDTKFDGDHLNGYNPGFKIDGCLINLTLSNQHCCLFVDYGDRWFHTSEVRKQEECEGYDLLHTLNSVYKVTPNFVAIPGAQEKYSLTLESDGEEVE
jgi:hypothetical protein